MDICIYTGRWRCDRVGAPQAEGLVPGAGGRQPRQAPAAGRQVTCAHTHECKLSTLNGLFKQRNPGVGGNHFFAIPYAIFFQMMLDSHKKHIWLQLFNKN